MAELPNALYLLGPNEPAGVFVWGKSPELIESDLAAGIARIGGHRPPDYGQAYLLAANTLLRTAQATKALDHHGLPIFFLQRHAAELMIKAPLKLGIDIQEYRKKRGYPCSGFPSKRQIKRVEKWHGLRELLSDLNAMAATLQVGTVPDVLSSAVDELIKVEQQHTWSRYSYRIEDGHLHRHMQDEITIPLGEIQNLLQEASNALGVIWPFSSGLIMGNLGSLYEYELRKAGEID